jgi:hypothetical protein
MAPPHVRRHRSPLTAALALLCLFAQVWSGVHAAAVPHERCAEHGEVVHAGEHGRGPEAFDAPLADELPGAAAAVADGEPRAAAEDEHDHCCVVSTRRQADTVPEVAAASRPPVELTHGALSAGVIADARALYRVAPKASPPSLA